jgi:hypothetical protein
MEAGQLRVRAAWRQRERFLPLQTKRHPANDAAHRSIVQFA